MRFSRLVGVSGLALMLGCALAGASAARPSGPTVVRFADATVGTVSRASQSLASPFAGTSGGTVTAANGEAVHVYAATQYIASDPSFDQRWADVLAAAPHGSELSSVSVVLLPLDRVQSLCGAQALACYSPDSEVIVAPGEDPAPDLPATDILLHEYGHHIAQNRRNDPWPAVDYGPKRWASDENICRQTANGTLHPGDEGSDYRLNPGEAWAETYRVYAERTLGLPAVPWTIVSSAFYPDDAALAAASADVLDPWAGPTATTTTGSFSKTQKERRLLVATPYDGSLSVSVGNRTKRGLKLSLVNKAGIAVATSSVAAHRTKSVRYAVCGERSLQLRLSRTTIGTGAYSVTVSKP